MRFDVANTPYSLEVDSRRDDCNKERPHCHILLHGSRIGQIFLHSFELRSSHRFTAKDLDRIFDAVSIHEREMREEYENNGR